MSRQYDSAVGKATDSSTGRVRRPVPPRPVTPRPAAPPPLELEEDDLAVEAPARNNSALIAGILVVGGIIALMLMAMIISNLNRPASAVNSAGGTGSSQAAGAGSGATGGAAAVLDDVTEGSRAVDFTAQSLDGQTVKLSDYRGKNPVWLNFWASWCGPCKAEMPAMQQLYQQYKDQGLVILGFDVSEPKSTVDNFVKAQGYSWNFLIEESGATSARYQTTGIPTHIFINKDGMIVQRISSGLPKDYMESQVKRLLGLTQ